MCGLTGFWQAAGQADAMSALAAAMALRIQHRGPDDAGTWVDADAGIALAHRRLSIVDLSPAGHQPMISAHGRFVLVFNGEIYNHNELRQGLQSEGAAPDWRGHSDTETLLACIQAWGLETTLKRSVGMFALALWDRAQRSLSLARDRMGEKPLYYGWQGDTFLFGSELKALIPHPAFRREVDRDVIALLLRHNYIPAPYSIWRGINKLPSGTCLTISNRQHVAEPKQYWSLAEVAERGEQNPLGLDAQAASIELERVLAEAVGMQMLADVPLGALLSGGIDSSMIVALMQAQSARPVKTFSIGFNESAFDESGHAAAVAKHLGTDHTELFMGAGDVLKAVPRIPHLYDEPFADSSQLPTALVMSLAREHVTVALSGDGGDELFGGYNRYQLVPKVWKMLRFLPHPIRTRIGQLLVGVPAARWDQIAGPIARILGQGHAGDKAHKLGHRLLQVRSVDDLYVALLTEWDNAEEIIPSSKRLTTSISSRNFWPNLRAPLSRMMAIDAISYMPDDILVKVDRAAMGVSLETRAPFLDHRVVEFAWSLPIEHKIHGIEGKWLLRQALYRHVPRKLIDRPKMGFGIPLDDWLRGELRDWAEALLSPDVLHQGGYFDVSRIRKVWAEHLSGRHSFGYRLWSVLMFQAWLTEYGD